MTLIVRARADEYEDVAAFYRRVGYGGGVRTEDVVLAATSDGVMCGATRLCREEHLLVLRGMHVAPDRQGAGIGTRLLAAAVDEIGERECWCVPHADLRAFYARVGFEERTRGGAPAFLVERAIRYTATDRAASVMVRPRGLPADLPTYGDAGAVATHVFRPGGYALIRNGRGEIAVVSTPEGLFLPGGGQHPGETLEETVVRETYEECGLRAGIVQRLGAADELFHSLKDAAHYRKRCVFFSADVIGQEGGGETDHELMWIAAEDAALRLRHESHRRTVVTAPGQARRR